MDRRVLVRWEQANLGFVEYKARPGRWADGVASGCSRAGKVADRFRDGDFAQDEDHRPSLASFSRGNWVPETAHCIQREIAGSGHADRERIIADRWLPRRSELAIASIPSSFFASQAWWKGESR